MSEKNFWETRYNQEEFIYGTTPNEYLKEKLQNLTPTKILFPAEGEGRNAVYASKLGWKSFAFDQSEEGKKKAELLAKNNNVEIFYTISDAENISYPNEDFDALVFIFAHFQGNKRKEIHQKLSGYLKSGGHLILQGFSKKQIAYQQTNPESGGPRDPEMLFDLEELKNDFYLFDFIEIIEKEVELDEGNHHKGKASIIQCFAIKK